MTSKNNKNSPEPGSRPEPLPSTGEGADSALDVLRRKRGESPPADPTLPVVPPKDGA